MLTRPGISAGSITIWPSKRGTCPFDGRELLPAQNLVDELIEAARLQGADVMIVRRRPDLLDKRSGVAAVTLPDRAGLGESVSSEVAPGVTNT